MVTDEFADRHKLHGHPVPGHLVDLGDDDHQGGPRGDGADLLVDPPVPGPDRLVGGDTQADDVNLGVGVAHQVVEALAEQRARAVQAGGVDQHDLEALAVHDAADGVPGGLRAAGGDRHLAADQGVGQRRLAGIGAADQAHETGLELGGTRDGHGVSTRWTSTVPMRSRPR